MKLKDLKKFVEIASDDAEITIKNGEIVITEPKLSNFKYNVGDKVILKDGMIIRTITGIRLVMGNDYPEYELDGYLNVREDKIELYAPQDITDKIKTFEDACEWCTENGHHNIRREYDCIVTDSLILDEASKDLVAYLKLRIITCALNEGWEPSDGRDKFVYVPKFNDEMWSITTTVGAFGDAALKLAFKYENLAAYAAEQFRDIYADFCGCKKKGGAK